MFLGVKCGWLVVIFNYWGVHPVAHVSSNVNKPPYATMFLVLVFIVHLHYMFRTLIGGIAYGGLLTLLVVICRYVQQDVST
jgi:hypothetical protein